VRCAADRQHPTQTGYATAEIGSLEAVSGAAALSGMQAEAVDVGAKVLLEVRIPG